MSDTLQVADLVNGKLDVETIAEVAMVGTTADTITNREGVEIDTLEGRLKKVGFEPPLAYAAGIEFSTPADAVKSFDQGGIIYGCLASSRPFTTTGNFAADEVNFFVIQDTSGQGDVSSSSSNTYATGTTQAFDAATADTMTVGGVDVTAKNVAQDEAIEDAESAASAADGKAVAAQNTADANALNILPKAETYYLNSTSAQRQITHSCSNDAASYTIEIFFNVNNDFSEETNKFVRVSTNGSEIRNLFIYDTSSSTVGATFTENFVRSAGTAFSLYFENDGDDKILSYTITLDKSSIEDTISVIYDTGLPSKVDSRELFTRFTPIA